MLETREQAPIHPKHSSQHSAVASKNQQSQVPRPFLGDKGRHSAKSQRLLRARFGLSASKPSGHLYHLAVGRKSEIRDPIRLFYKFPQTPDAFIRARLWPLRGGARVDGNLVHPRASPLSALQRHPYRPALCAPTTASPSGGEGRG